MKICRNVNCKQINPQNSGSFFKDKSKSDGLCPLCKVCEHERKRIWRRNNLDKVNSRARQWTARNPDKVREKLLKDNYGMTLAEYDALLIRQKGLCAICKQPSKDMMKGKVKALAVDHDHKTGKIRGLLCKNCNVGLGSFADSVKNLKEAITYLAYKD